MTCGVNFGANNVTNAVNIAKPIVKAFYTQVVKNSRVKLDIIEVGE